MISVTITVDDEQLMAALTNVERGLDQFVDRVAEELSRTAADEAGERSRRLGASWPVIGSGPVERHVNAPEWWAHFLAGGTQAHGPRTAPRLVFDVDGATVYAMFVSGITADPFDARAVARTESRVDDLLRQVIEGAA